MQTKLFSTYSSMFRFSFAMLLLKSKYLSLCGPQSCINSLASAHLLRCPILILLRSGSRALSRTNSFTNDLAERKLEETSNQGNKYAVAVFAPYLRILVTSSLTQCINIMKIKCLFYLIISKLEFKMYMIKFCLFSNL